MEKKMNVTKLMITGLLVMLMVFTGIIPATAGDSDLILDDPGPSVIEKSEYKIEGEIPIGATVVVNGKDAEVFRKFRHTVKLEKDPSINPVEIVVTDADGELIESRKIQIENYGMTRIWIQCCGSLEMKVNNETVKLDVPVQIIIGRTMVPFIAIAHELFDVTINWSSLMLTLEFDDGSVVLTAGGRIALLNGEPVQLDAPPVVIDNEMMVPFRFIAEAFGAVVAWISDEKAITINRELHPSENPIPINPVENTKNLILDIPNPSVLEKTEFALEGEIPIGATVTVNGEEVEVFRKFRIALELKEPPSFTPVNFEVKNAEGNYIESREINIENIYILRMKLVIGKSEMTVNGETVLLDEPAQIIDGRAMVPVRAVADSFGAAIDWIGSTRTVVINYGDINIELLFGNKTAKINGLPVELDVPAQIVRGRTMVPFRFIAEAFGAEVAWLGDERAITIEKKIYP